MKISKLEKKKPLFLLLICMTVGFIIGNLTGILALLEIIPKEIFRNIPKACIGLMVLIVDTLCIWGIINRRIYNTVDTMGESVVGTVTGLIMIPNKKQLNLNDWQKQVSYSCTVSYKVKQRVYERDLPPTTYISPQELYPNKIEEGGEIKLKYHKKFPRRVMIDIDVLKEGYFNQTKRIHIVLPLIISIVSALYILYVLCG